MIQALMILINEKGLKDLVLQIVGDTDRDKSFSQNVKGYSREAGLDRYIIFHGRMNDRDMEELYGNSDIFVFQSRWEGFGMALAEAASFGLPIVTTDAGAIPCLIKDGVNGLLVPPKDPERLAQTIEKLLNSPELMARFSEANRQVAEQFDWDESFKKVADLVESLGSN